MQPSHKWFPTSLQERAAWYQNFSTQFLVVATQLGFTVLDQSGVDADNLIVQFLAQTAVDIDSYKDAVRQYRVIMLEGNVGDPMPSFPANTSFSAPASRPTGIFERLDELVKRIRVSPSYTDEIGALLGILPSGSGSVSPIDLKPVIKAVALPGSVVLVSFVRGSTDGVIVETKLDNGTWSDAGRYFKSPAQLPIPQNADNLPRAVQVRARYVDGDTPVGQLSSVVSTATQPEG